MLTKYMQGLHARLLAQDGQGTVEYVGLLLLLAGVFAAVASAEGSVGKDFAKLITDEIQEAVGRVTK